MSLYAVRLDQGCILWDTATQVALLGLEEGAKGCPKLRGAVTAISYVIIQPMRASLDGRVRGLSGLQGPDPWEVGMTSSFTNVGICK